MTSAFLCRPAVDGLSTAAGNVVGVRQTQWRRNHAEDVDSQGRDDPPDQPELLLPVFGQLERVRLGRDALVIGLVVAVERGSPEKNPLVHYDGRYGRLAGA